MRLTYMLCKESMTKRFNLLWRDKSKIKIPAIRISPVLTDANVKIINPVDEYLKKPVITYPHQPTLSPGSRIRSEKDLPNYHEKPMLSFNFNSVLFKGLTQAQILTNTLVASETELPAQCQAGNGKLSLPRQDELMQRYIMMANVWDPTKVKLAKRFNPQLPGWKFKAEHGLKDSRIMHTLLRNLTHMQEMAAAKHPSLSRDRRLATQPYLNTVYSFQGTPIQICGQEEYMVSSCQPLAPFADSESVAATKLEELPSLHPLHPLIDIKPTHRYSLEDITPWRSGFTHPHPHTLYLPYMFRFQPGVREGRVLMYMYGQCVAHARALYGPDVVDLPEPVCMQAVQTDKANFELFAFQLNTLDCSGDASAVKNLFWMDTRNQLYKKLLPKRAMLRNTKYEDYDGRVLEKLLGLYATGWEE